MSPFIKRLIITEIVVLIGSIISFYIHNDTYIITTNLSFISLNFILFTIGYHHLKKSDNSRVYAYYLLGLVALYNWINYESTIGVETIFYFDTEYPLHTIKSIINIILPLLSVYFIIKQYYYTLLFKSKLFYLSLVLITYFFITQIPFYGIHGAGSGHGHNYYNSGLHFH